MALPLDAGWPEVRERLGQGDWLLAFDFDGTLAPLAPKPALAQMPLAVRNQLAELAAAPGLHVMINSGRALPDLKERVGLPEVFLAGNHGLEGCGPGWHFLEPAAQTLQGTVHHLAEELRQAAGPIPGVLIEDKALSLSVHYRLVETSLAEVLRQRVEAVVRRHANFLCRQGHLVLEIRPKLAANKGTILGRVLHLLELPASQMLYCGDDRTDEDAFAAWPAAVTIRVGELGSETQARFLLERPVDVAELLQRIARLRQGS